MHGTLTPSNVRTCKRGKMKAHIMCVSTCRCTNACACAYAHAHGITHEHVQMATTGTAGCSSRRRRRRRSGSPPRRPASWRSRRQWPASSRATPSSSRGRLPRSRRPAVPPPRPARQQAALRWPSCFFSRPPSSWLGPAGRRRLPRSSRPDGPLGLGLDRTGRWAGRGSTDYVFTQRSMMRATSPVCTLTVHLFNSTLEGAPI